MSWQQLHLQCPKSAVELTEALFYEAGAVSILLEDAGDEPLFEPMPGEEPLWSDVVITALNRHPTKARTMQLPIWQTASLASRFTDPETREKFEVVKGELQLTIPPKTARVLIAT